MVGDAARAEPEAGELRVPVVRRDAARDERARADRPEGDLSRRRHAHMECVLAARKRGELPTEDEFKKRRA